MATAQILVDAGYPGYFGQLERAVEAVGKRLGDIDGVLVTHHHVDHTGTAEAVRTRAGASVYAHAADAAKVRGEIASHPPRSQPRRKQSAQWRGWVEPASLQRGP
ncbi:MAG: MBL fold metallo-hydrolase [Gaiellaceae bacterium]